MQRPLYAVCPRCGSRAKITRFIRDMEEDESFAMIKCACGRYRIPYVEGRVVSVDLNNPSAPPCTLKGVHFCRCIRSSN